MLIKAKKNNIMIPQKKIRLLFVVMAFVVMACNQDNSNITDDITVPVRLADVKLGSISNTLSVTGTVSPIGVAELKTEAAGGYHLMINPRTGQTFKLGDKVLKDEIIIKIEDREYSNGIRIETKKLDLDIKKSDYNKQKSLFEKGGVTLSNMQQAEVSYINSQYDYEKAELQLEMLNVKAPFSGVIVKMPYFTEKVRVASGTDVLKIMDYSRLLLNVDFPEKHLAIINKGQIASITNYNLEEDTLMAVVAQLSPAIDESSRTFSGVLEVDNSQLIFRPGMFVNANIILKKKDDVITVPSEIISKGKRGFVIYTVSRNTAEQKQIKTGIETDSETEIIKGLEVGDRIVIEGYQMLSNRAKVKVLK